MTPPRGDLLLVKPGSMGDVVHALPIVHALKAAYPERRLTWIIDRRWAPLLDGVTCVDRIIEFPRTEFRGALGWLRAMAWFGKLSGVRADVAIDLQGLMRSGLMVTFSRSRDSIGLSDAREGAAKLVRRTADVSRCRHAVDRYLQVLPLCGVEIPETPVFPLGPGVLPVGCPGGAVVIHPFARGEGKSLSDAAVAELCRALAPHTVVLCGQGATPANLGSHVVDFSNRTTLPGLIGILRSARMVISVDSGPMHIAAALGRPLLAIHTWSDPRKVGPYSKTAWICQGGEIRKQSFAGDARILPEKPFDSSMVSAIADWAGRQDRYGGIDEDPSSG